MNHKSPQKRPEGASKLDPKRALPPIDVSPGDGSDPDPRGFLAGKNGLKHEELSEELGQSFVETVTSGEDAETEKHDRITDVDRGGPFVASTARKEFAKGTDRSNPADAEPAAFPTANHVSEGTRH